MVAEQFVFADESGIGESDPFCAVLGYIGSRDQWNLVDTAWRETLITFGIEDCFHAKDFFGRKGPYREWTEEQCDEFLDRLLQVTGSQELRPVGGAIENAAFYALSTGERRALTGGRISDAKLAWKASHGAPTRPWYLGFHHLIISALDEAEPGATVHFIFDRQHEFSKHTYNVYRLIVEREIEKYHRHELSKAQSIGGLRFEDKGRLTPLQVADLYTHVWYSFLTRNSDRLAASGDRLTPLTVGSRRGRALSALIPQRPGIATYGTADMEQTLSQYNPAIRAWLKSQP